MNAMDHDEMRKVYYILTELKEDMWRCVKNLKLMLRYSWKLQVNYLQPTFKVHSCI